MWGGDGPRTSPRSPRCCRGASPGPASRSPTLRRSRSQRQLSGMPAIPISPALPQRSRSILPFFLHVLFRVFEVLSLWTMCTIFLRWSPKRTFLERRRGFSKNSEKQKHFFFLLADLHRDRGALVELLLAHGAGLVANFLESRMEAILC